MLSSLELTVKPRYALCFILLTGVSVWLQEFSVHSRPQLTCDTGVTRGHFGTHIRDLTVEDLSSNAFLLVMSKIALAVLNTSILILCLRRVGSSPNGQQP